MAAQRVWLEGDCFCGNHIPKYSNVKWCDECLDLYKLVGPIHSALDFIQYMKLFRLMCGK